MLLRFALLFVVSPMMSCSKSKPTVPDEAGAPDNNTAPEDSPLRSIFWNNNNDIDLYAEETDDRSVDVSNVVFDRGYIFRHDSQDPEDWTNGLVGYVVDTCTYWGEAADPLWPFAAEFNVIAWAQRHEEEVGAETHVYYDVYFKVYGVTDDPGTPVINGAEVQIPSEYWVYFPAPPGDPIPLHVSHSRPKITAWLDSGDGTSGTDILDPRLYIAVAYQYREAWEDVDNRSVYVTIYRQVDAEDYDAWEEVVTTEVAPTEEEWAWHPDIVYGAYYGPWETYYHNPNFEALVLTYEEIDSESLQRSIRLAELHEDSGWGDDWEIDDDYIPTFGDPAAIPFYPRIDIGLDNSDAQAHGPGDDGYYIAVVAFNYVIPVLEGQEYHYKVNLYTAWKAYNVGISFVDWEAIDFYDEYEPKNALPYVEIDPLENRLSYGNWNYTHIVWSRLADEDGNKVEPRYTNSFEQHGDGDEETFLIEGADDLQRIGLPTITAYAHQIIDIQSGDRTVGSVQYIAEDGNNHYPVFSETFVYVNDDKDSSYFGGTQEAVSTGYSDDEPWSLGPTSALRGMGGEILCAWTDFYYQNPPDIYADLD